MYVCLLYLRLGDVKHLPTRLLILLPPNEEPRAHLLCHLKSSIERQKNLSLHTSQHVERGRGQARLGWRKGSFLNPFCHLVIQSVRWDSNPPCFAGKSCGNLLRAARLRLKLSRDQFAAELGVSIATVKNWEHGRTRPSRRFWRPLASLFRDGTQGSAPRKWRLVRFREPGA